MFTMQMALWPSISIMRLMKAPFLTTKWFTFCVYLITTNKIVLHASNESFISRKCMPFSPNWRLQSPMEQIKTSISIQWKLRRSKVGRCFLVRVFFCLFIIIIYWIFMWTFVCKCQNMLHFLIFNNFCYNHSPSESRRCCAKRVISLFKQFIKISKNGQSFQANDVNQLNDTIIYGFSRNENSTS